MTKVQKNNKELMVTLTSVQDSPLGKIVGHIYYSTNLLDLIKSTGYPHNGGQHSLTIRGSKNDILSFLDLVIETFESPSGRFSEGISEISKLKLECDMV